MGETDEGGRTGQRGAESLQILQSTKGAKVPTITLLLVLCSGLCWVTELPMGGRPFSCPNPPSRSNAGRFRSSPRLLSPSCSRFVQQCPGLASQPARSPPAWQGTGEGAFPQHPAFLHFLRGKGVLLESWGGGRASLAPGSNELSYLVASHTMEKLNQIFPSNTGGPMSTRRPQSTKSSAFSRAVLPGTPQLGRRMAWTACPPWGRPRTQAQLPHSPPETSQVTPFCVGPNFSL